MKAGEFVTSVVTTKKSLSEKSPGFPKRKDSWVRHLGPLLEVLEEAQGDKELLDGFKGARPAWVGGTYSDPDDMGQPVRAGKEGHRASSRNVLVLDLDGAKENLLPPELAEHLIESFPYPAVVSPSFSDSPDGRSLHVFVPLSSSIFEVDCQPVTQSIKEKWEKESGESIDKWWDTSAGQLTRMTFLSGLKDGTPAPFYWINEDIDILDPATLEYSIDDKVSFVGTRQPSIEVNTPVGALTRICEGTLAGAVELGRKYNLKGNGLLVPRGRGYSWVGAQSVTYEDLDDGSGNCYVRSPDSRIYQDQARATGREGPCVVGVGLVFLDVLLRGYGTGTSTKRWSYADASALPKIQEVAATLMKKAGMQEELATFISETKAATEERKKKGVDELIDLLAQAKASEDKAEAAQVETTGDWRDLVYNAKLHKKVSPSQESHLVLALNASIAEILGDADKAEKTRSVPAWAAGCIADNSATLRWVSRDIRNCALRYADNMPGATGDIMSDMLVGVGNELCAPGGFLSYDRGTIERAVYLAASRNQVNPVMSELITYAQETLYTQHSTKLLGEVCPWQKTPTPYAKKVFYAIIMGMVARTMIPGIKLDIMPVVWGGQGTGKTSLINTIGRAGFIPGVTEGAFPAGLLKKDIDGKELGAYLDAVSSSLLVSFDEFDQMWSIRGVTTSSLKDFLSRTEWTYVPKYSREPETRPVSFLTVATSNRWDNIPCDDGWRRFPMIEVDGWASADECLTSIQSSGWYGGETPAVRRVIGEAVLRILGMANECGGNELVAALIRTATPHPAVFDVMGPVSSSLAALKRMLDEDITGPFRTPGPMMDEHRAMMARHMGHADIGRALRDLAATETCNVDGNVYIPVSKVTERLLDDGAIPAGTNGRSFVAGWSTVLGGILDESRGDVILPASVGKSDGEDRTDYGKLL